RSCAAQCPDRFLPFAPSLARAVYTGRTSPHKNRQRSRCRVRDVLRCPPVHRERSLRLVARDQRRSEQAPEAYRSDFWPVLVQSSICFFLPPVSVVIPLAAFETPPDWQFVRPSMRRPARHRNEYVPDSL